jgi:FMN phosphatase YigB (HAD superfamily)
VTEPPNVTPPNVNRPLRAVLFDLDETLWDFPSFPPPELIERTVARRFRALFRSWGVEPSRPAREINLELLRRHTETDDSSDDPPLRAPDHVAMTREVLADAGIEVTDDQVAAIRAAFDPGGPFLGRRIFDDTHETLEWLRSRDLRIAAVSNRWYSGPGFLDELRYHRLLDYFDVLAGSDVVGWRKPHPRIFEHVLDELGVAASEAAHVGDRPDADVRGARAAGLTAIWRPHPRHPERRPGGPDEEPHFTIDELSDLRALPLFEG